MADRAELKISKDMGTRKAIREALGQLLEYNFYPGRTGVDHWVIILDRRATHEDVLYIHTLRQQFGLPMSLGWSTSTGFMFPKGLNLI